MADYTIDEISELVKADILSESQGVGELEVVSSLAGINSLPALRGNQVVEAPLELLSKDANEAARRADESASKALSVANHPTYIGEDYYVYVWDCSSNTYNKTSVYVRGEGFKISKTYGSVEKMESDTEHGLKEGDFVLINTDDVENPDNAKVYVVNNKGGFSFFVDMSGAIGFTGKTPQFEIGIVTTGAGREDASATLTDDGFDDGGNPKYLLNIKIPSIRLSDLSDEEIALLQSPANDMISQLSHTDKSVNEEEMLRQEAEKYRKEEFGILKEQMEASIDNANDTSDHPTYIGKDNYVYVWDKDNKVYEKTTVYVKGNNGQAPVIVVGSVTTLEPNSQASATVEPYGENSEGKPIFKLNLAIPKGEKGVNGTGSGNVLVDTSGLQGGKTYLFKPSQNESAEGAFVEYEVPEIDTTTLATKEDLNGKVDKVDGKQLSTEDFTTVLKEKLGSLSNYDDTAIQNAVNGLQTQLDTLVSGNSSTAIESFNEIVAFLEGVTDSESLDSIIASIEQQIAAKQDRIDDLQTIREGAAKGATALQPVPGGYAKISEIPTKVSDLENDANFLSIEETTEEVDEPNIEESGDSVSTKRIIACVLRFDGSKWNVLDNEGHVPINVTGVSGTTTDSVTISFPEYSKVNTLVVTPDETLAAAGIKCGASVGLDYATIHLRQDRMVRLMVTMDSSGTGGEVTRQEWDERTNMNGWTVKKVENSSLGNYIRIEDPNGNIDGTSLPTVAGAFNCFLFGTKPGYMNIQLRNPDGSVSDYKSAQFQVGFPILNGTPILTEHECTKGNIWVYGIMEE